MEKVKEEWAYGLALLATFVIVPVIPLCWLAAFELVARKLRWRSAMESIEAISTHSQFSRTQSRPVWDSLVLARRIPLTQGRAASLA